MFLSSMDLISKQILVEEDWNDIILWNIQDHKRYLKKQKRKIKKLIYTLLKVMSKIVPKFKGRIEKGRMIFNRLGDYLNYVQGLEGKEVSLILQEWKNDRSDNQNRYYWGIPIKMISEYTGYSDEEVHELLKSLFLKKKVDVKTTKGITERHTIVGSTATLNTAEFEEYLAKVRQWASEELNIYVPEPNETSYD